MKITKLFFAIAIVIFAFTSCEKSTKDLSNAIPADAGYIVHINTQSMIEKANYDIFKNVTVERGINMAKAMIGGSKEAVDMIDAFTKNVNSLGLDLKGDCYIYTNYVITGVVLGVNDAAKIKSSLMNIPGMQEDLIKVDGDVYYIQNNPVIAAWNKEKFLIITHMDVSGRRSSGEMDLLAQAKKQLTQGEKESVNSNSNFSKFLADKKDISVFFSYSFENIKPMLEMSGADLPAGIISELEQLKGITSAGYISFEKGEIVAQSKAYYDNADTEKKYKELSASLCGNIKGEQLKYVPENPIFVMSMNLKGKGIYDYLKKLGIMDKVEPQAAEADINLASLFEKFEGDVTFAINNILSVKKSFDMGGGEKYEYDSKMPELSFFVDVKDGQGLLDMVKSKLGDDFTSSGDVKEIDANTYSFDMSGTNAYAGLANNMFFLTNSEKAYNGVKSSGAISKGYDSLIKNKMMFMAGNLAPIKEPVLEEIKDEKGQQMFKDFIDMFGSYEFTASTDMGGSGKIGLVDKNQNSLAAIFQYVDKLLTSVNEYLR